MYYAHAVVGKLGEREWIEGIHSNGPTAEKAAKTLNVIAEDESNERHGATFAVQQYFFSLDIFDMWAGIRRHPAYAFGALFVQGDFDRAIPEGFEEGAAEQLLVDAGQDHIDGLYTGEPAKHRLKHRLLRRR